MDYSYPISFKGGYCNIRITFDMATIFIKRMNIKNIIKEEVDDFGWAKEPINPFIEDDVALVIDRPINEIESQQLFDLLVAAGRTTEKRNTLHHRIPKLVRYSERERNKMYTRTDGFMFGMDEMPSHIETIYYYTELYDNNLNESDDWQWADEIVPNSPPYTEDTLPYLVGYEFRYYTHGRRSSDTSWKITDVSDGVVHYGNLDEFDNLQGIETFLKYANQKHDNGSSWSIVNPHTNEVFDYYEPLLKESDGLEWMDEIVPCNTLEPETGYYFQPPLKHEEMAGFVNSICKEQKGILSWLHKVFKPHYKDMEHGFKCNYFVTTDNPNIIQRRNAMGWCNQTSISEAKREYKEKFINAREQFIF